MYCCKAARRRDSLKARPCWRPLLSYSPQRSLHSGLYFLVDKVDHAAAKADEAILQEKSSEATDIDLANALRTSAADRVLADETIPAYSNAQVRSMDVSKPSGVTEAELKLITKGNLKGLESSFVKAEKDYGVNCLFVVAIASLESAGWDHMLQA